MKSYYPADEFRMTVNDSSVWELPPVEYIRSMFERTSDGGTLIEAVFGEEGKRPGPDFRTKGDSFQYRYECSMEWTEADRDRVIAEYKILYDALYQIAQVYDRLGNYEKENEELLFPSLMKVWKTYVRSFRSGSFDMERIGDIRSRMEILNEGRLIDLAYTLNLPVDEGDEAVWQEYKKTKVTKEESDYYRAYVNSLVEQAEKRLQRKPMAFPLVRYSQRLCRLMSLGAPKVVIEYEARNVAQALVINSFARECRLLECNMQTNVIKSGKSGCELSDFAESDDE